MHGCRCSMRRPSSMQFHALIHPCVYIHLPLPRICHETSRHMSHTHAIHVPHDMPGHMRYMCQSVGPKYLRAKMFHMCYRCANMHPSTHPLTSIHPYTHRVSQTSMYPPIHSSIHACIPPSHPSSMHACMQTLRTNNAMRSVMQSWAVGSLLHYAVRSGEVTDARFWYTAVSTFNQSHMSAWRCDSTALGLAARAGMSLSDKTLLMLWWNKALWC